MQNQSPLFIDASGNSQARHGVLGPQQVAPNPAAIQGYPQPGMDMRQVMPSPQVVPSPQTIARPTPQPQEQKSQASMGPLFMVHQTVEGKLKKCIAASLYQSVAEAIAADADNRVVKEETVIIIGEKVFILKSKEAIAYSSLKGRAELARRALAKLSDEEREVLGFAREESAEKE